MKQVAVKKKGTQLAKPQHQQLQGKLPPQAMDLEELIIGVLLTDQKALSVIVDILRPDHFYSPQFSTIYQAIVNLFVQANPVDLITVATELRKTATLEMAGGSFELTQLAAKASSAGNIEHYARVIIERSMKRAIIQIVSDVLHNSFDETIDPVTILDNAEGSVLALRQQNVKKDIRSMPAAVHEALGLMHKRMLLQEELSGIPSGNAALDRFTSGWQRSDLILIAARPGMGKTGTVLTFMINAAVHRNIPVGMFSLEMASYQLTNRMISAMTDIPGENLVKGNLTDEEMNRIVHLTAPLSEAPIYIDDTPALTIAEFRSKARRMKAEQNVQLIIVDYLQLMHGDTSGNREQEIASISRSLKAIAKELDIPVIGLAQLSRSVETRGGDKRPALSDLRESGSLEQDADVVIFLYRAEYYKIPIDEDGMPTQNIIELIIAKHRNGQTGTAKAKFIGQFTRLEELDY